MLMVTILRDHNKVTTGHNIYASVTLSWPAFSRPQSKLARRTLLRFAHSLIPWEERHFKVLVRLSEGFQIRIFVPSGLPAGNTSL